MGMEECVPVFKNLPRSGSCTWQRQVIIHHPSDQGSTEGDAWLIIERSGFQRVEKLVRCLVLEERNFG